MAFDKKTHTKADLSGPGDTHVESPRRKKNAMQGIQDTRSAEPTTETSVLTEVLLLETALLTLIERHWPHLADGTTVSVSRPDPMVESGAPVAMPVAGVTEHEVDLRRLRERVAKLEAENGRLLEQHRQDADARQNEMQLLQAAFSQFQRETDQLLMALDRENAGLRSDEKD